MKKIYFSKFLTTFFIIFSATLLFSCEALKYKPVDAKEYPPEPEKRVKKNIEEGRGFRLFDGDPLNRGGGIFQFASSNF